MSIHPFVGIIRIRYLGYHLSQPNSKHPLNSAAKVHIYFLTAAIFCKKNDFPHPLYLKNHRQGELGVAEVQLDETEVQLGEAEAQLGDAEVELGIHGL